MCTLFFLVAVYVFPFSSLTLKNNINLIDYYNTEEGKQQDNLGIDYFIEYAITADASLVPPTKERHV